MTITLAYKSVDGVREKKTFATLVGARRYAEKRVGLDAEAWGVRATSFDGIGVLTLVEVMKEPPMAPFEIRDMETLLRGKAPPEPDPQAEARAADRAAEIAGMEAYAAEMRTFEAPRRGVGCTCSDQQLNLVGCDCAAEMPL